MTRQMTKEEATKFAPIIKAYSEGKTIQFIGEDGKWHDFTCEDVVFADDPNEYRIKPEAKYRPFANAQECWEEMQKHQPFGWIKEKGEQSYEYISEVYSLYIRIVKRCNEYYLMFREEDADEEGEGSSYIGDLLQDYTFADGKPFGVEDND